MNLELITLGSTVFDLIAYLFVVGIFLYLRNKTAASISLSYTFLALMWVFIALSSLAGVVKLFLSPTFKQVWGLKISM